MNAGAKRNQPRSSWWSASSALSDKQSWFSSVRQQIAEKSSTTTSPGAGFSSRQAKKSSR